MCFRGFWIDLNRLVTVGQGLITVNNELPLIARTVVVHAFTKRGFGAGHVARGVIAAESGGNCKGTRDGDDKKQETLHGMVPFQMAYVGTDIPNILPPDSRLVNRLVERFRTTGNSCQPW